MTIQLRQICLVAEKLAPVIDDLTVILGVHSCRSLRVRLLRRQPP